MRKLQDLLEIIPEKLFLELLEDKLKNIKKRARDYKNILTKADSYLSSYKSKIGYIDNLLKEIRDLIGNNNIELKDTVFNEYKEVITKYSNLVGIIKNFNEEEPGINEIFSSNQWITFINSFNTWERGNGNGLSTLEKLKIDLERLLNNLNILDIKNQKNKFTLEFIEKLKQIDIKSLEKANSIAESLLEKKNIIQTSGIQQASKYFTELSGDYQLYNGSLKNFLDIFQFRKYKNIWWIILSMIIGGFLIYIIWILSKGKELTSGDILARFSIIVIGIYFIIIFSKQFENSQKLKDLYKYKKTSLEVMIKLKEISSEEERDKILDKALEVIFLPVGEKCEIKKENNDINRILLEMLKKGNIKN